MQKIDRILKLPEVIVLTGIKKSTIYKYVKTGEFPAQVRLTDRSVGWRESEIAEFNATRKKVV